MPPPEDDTPADLARYSQRLRDDSRQLRDVSKQLLEYIKDLHELEQQSRTVPMGSPEFARLSGQITALSHRVFRLSVEQEEAGERLPEQPTTIEELDRLEEGASRSSSA